MVLPGRSSLTIHSVHHGTATTEVKRFSKRTRILLPLQRSSRKPTILFSRCLSWFWPIGHIESPNQASLLITCTKFFLYQSIKCFTPLKSTASNNECRDQPSNVEEVVARIRLKMLLRIPSFHEMRLGNNEFGNVSCNGKVQGCWVGWHRIWRSRRWVPSICVCRAGPMRGWLCQKLPHKPVSGEWWHRLKLVVTRSSLPMETIRANPKEETPERGYGSRIGPERDTIRNWGSF